MFGQSSNQAGNRKTRVLHIDSSILGGPSASRQLSEKTVDALRAAIPGAEVIRRDLVVDHLPHLDGHVVAASVPGSDVDPVIQEQVARNAVVLDEFLSADYVVIGAPMYNFGIPSQLKAWIDRIVVAGRTFQYTDAGPRGLARGKKVIIVSSRGGIYEAGTQASGLDFQETYLRTVLRFLGIEDIEFIRAEGLAIGPQQREDAMQAAFASIAGVVRRLVQTPEVEVQQAA